MTDRIAVESLVKHYGRTVALDGVSFRVNGPGLYGLVGKNGAGKTTLLAVLAGALRPTAGTARLLGEACGSPGLFGRVGVLTQDADFRRGVSIRRQLIHFSRLGGASKQQAVEQMSAILERTGDGNIVNRVPESLSFGQRKRLAIVQALMGSPEVILLDEATAGLDPPAAATVRELARERAAHAAVILSSHNLYEIEDLCSRVLVIDQGRLVSDSEVAGLTRGGDTFKLILDRALAAADVAVLNRLPEITEVSIDPSAGSRLTIRFASADANRLQLKVQESLVGLGYGVIEMSRNRTLADGYATLVSGK